MHQKNQTLRNLIFNALALMASIALGLFYTPYLVKSLGIVAYGIVPLALIINQYINVITGSLTGSLTRFYSVTLRKESYAEASAYFSSCFFAVSGIVLIMILLFTPVILNIESVFNIPNSFIKASQLLFTFTVLSFILSLYSSLYNITLYTQNRLDLLNVIKIARIAIKIAFTIVFFEYFEKDIAYIGYANFLTELFVLALSIYYYRLTVDQRIRLSFSSYNKIAMLSMLSMSWWVIVHQLGDTGLYRIDNILVNHFWSTRESGILGALTEFGSYVMAVVTVLSSLFGPLILIAYSDSDHQRVKELTLNNSLLVGVLAALFTGMLIGFAQPVIRLWLGAEYVEYQSWFILKQVTLPFYAAAGVFAFVYRAWNRVIWPAIFTLIMGASNLLLAYIVCKMSNGSEHFILAVLIIATFFILSQSYFLNAFFFLKLYKEVGVKTLIVVFLKILAGLACASLLSVSYNQVFKVFGVLELFIGMAVVTALFSGLSYFILLNHLQRRMILGYLSSISNFFNK
jgi:O-antigen/teichoic acid export membrane protein